MPSQNITPSLISKFNRVFHKRGQIKIYICYDVIDNESLIKSKSRLLFTIYIDDF